MSETTNQTAERLLHQIWEAADAGDIDGVDLAWMVEVDQYFGLGGNRAEREDEDG